MAIFTDQFDRRPPLKMVAPEFFDGRLSLVIDRACSLLFERRRSFDWTDVAVEFERHLQEKAVEVARAWSAEHGESDGQPWMTRESWNELSLMFYDIDSGEEVAAPYLPHGCHEEELLAVVALWMVADVLDALEAAALNPSTWDSEGTLGRAFDAARAAEMAHSACRLRLMTGHLDAQLRDEIVKRVDQEERAHARGRAGSKGRWDHLADFKARALEIAESKQHRGLMPAARYVAERLDAKPRPKHRPDDPLEYYPAEKVAAWLVEMNFRQPNWPARMPSKRRSQEPNS